MEHVAHIEQLSLLNNILNNWGSSLCMLPYLTLSNGTCSTYRAAELSRDYIQPRSTSYIICALASLFHYKLCVVPYSTQILQICLFRLPLNVYNIEIREDIKHKNRLDLSHTFCFISLALYHFLRIYTCHSRIDRWIDSTLLYRDCRTFSHYSLSLSTILPIIKSQSYPSTKNQLS